MSSPRLSRKNTEAQGSRFRSCLGLLLAVWPPHLEPRCPHPPKNNQGKHRCGCLGCAGPRRALKKQEVCCANYGIWRPGTTASVPRPVTTLYPVYLFRDSAVFGGAPGRAAWDRGRNGMKVVSRPSQAQLHIPALPLQLHKLN